MHFVPINRILRSSIVDGPGNRAVIFVQGCNYRCIYCHNPETIRLCRHCGECVPHCPVDALTIEQGKIKWFPERCVMCDACIKICRHDSCPRIRDLSAVDIMKEIESVMPFIRGITVSGGECTLYPEFLCELFELAHEKKLTCFLDTNGSFDFEKSPTLLDCTDGIMLDIKAMNGYGTVTGGSGAGVLERAVFLAKSRKLWEIRTVIVPNMMNAYETVREICENIAPVGNQVRYKLIKYRPVGVSSQYAASLETPGDDLMEALACIVKSYSMTPVII